MSTYVFVVRHLTKSNFYHKVSHSKNSPRLQLESAINKMKSLSSRPIIKAIIFLSIARFSNVVSAKEIVPDNEIPLETEPPTLPVISVTLPAGVTTDDKDIADVIDSLIRGGGMEEETTSAPTAMPTKKPYKSLKETMFRQEFKVNHSKEFTNHEVKAFEELHQQYTVYFSPLSPAEVEKTIKTVCTVNRQSLESNDDDRRSLRRGAERSLEMLAQESLYLDFTMTYESTHYNVTEYPKLFQNWSANNLDVVLDQMRFMEIDVQSVDIPRRIVISTRPPSVTPSTTSRDESITIATTTDSTPAITSKTGSKWSVAAIVVFSIALLLAVATLCLGVSVFLSKQSCFDDEVAEANQNRDPQDYWKESHPHNHPDDTTSTMDSVIMIDSHLAHYP